MDCQHKYLALSILVERDEDSDPQVAGDLSYSSCETWTLNTDLKRQIDVFQYKTHSKDHWVPQVWLVWFFHETESRPSIILQCQLWASGMLPRSQSCLLGRLWKRLPSMEETKETSTELMVMVSSCWELLGMGREPALRLARCDHQEWYHKVGEVMHSPVFTLSSHYRSASRLFPVLVTFFLLANQGREIHLAATPAIFTTSTPKLVLPISDSITTAIFALGSAATIFFTMFFVLSLV